ncbi:MAG: hypothetical protein WCA28_03660 [Bradyrhizobium sp.]
MAELTYFMVVPFDYVDGGIVAGEPIKCPSPAAAISRAQGLWKTFGHAGAIAISRSSDFTLGKFDGNRVLRRFGQVPNEY